MHSVLAGLLVAGSKVLEKASAEVAGCFTPQFL